MRFFHLASRRLQRRPRDRGAVMVMAVPALLLCVVSCALGIDIGRVTVDKRSIQSVADMAALDAARAVGLVLGTTNQAGYVAAAQSAANTAAARNRFSVGSSGRTITAAVGTINAATNAFSSGTGASAVQVTTTSHIDNAFLPGGHNLTARAVAFVGSPIAAFSVGSTLASLDTSKSRLDPMLKTMLGANGNLSLVSYQGLATGNVSVQKLQTALLNAGFNVGTVSQLLSADLTAAQLLNAMAAALTADGDNTAAAEINDIINAGITASTKLQLSDLLTIASPSDNAVLAAEFNAYQLVVGAAELMNGSNFVSVPLTGVNLLGLTGVAVSAYVVEPAKTAIGPVGTSAENAQVRMRVSVNVPLGGLLPVANVQLDYTTAQAFAALSSITCGASPSLGVTGNAAAVSVSGLATTVLGSMTITSAAGATPSKTLTFAHPTEFAPTVTKHLGSTGTGVSLASVTVTGSGATAALAPVLQGLLPTTLATLDTALQPLIKPMLQALGLGLSQADVAALGIYPDATSCGGHPRLAQ